MENVVYRKYIRETFVEKNIYILKFLKRVYLDVYQRKMRTRNTLRFHDGGNNLQPIGIGNNLQTNL